MPNENIKVCHYCGGIVTGSNGKPAPTIKSGSGESLLPSNINTRIFAFIMFMLSFIPIGLFLWAICM